MNAQTKHTPGPWSYGLRTRRTGANGRKESTVLAIDADRNNIGCVSNFVGPNAATAQANARLIAAAPDLLGALVDLMDELGALTRDPRNEAEANARAAIAKAVTP